MEEHSRLEGFKLKQILAGKEKTTDSLSRARRERRPPDPQVFGVHAPSAVGEAPAWPSVSPWEAGGTCSEPLSTYSRIQGSRSFF